jgi:uncharacterized OB-fold protein
MMGIKCPQCGTENLEGALFCDECGASLSDVGVEAEKAEATPVEVEQPQELPQVAVGKACPSCGHINPEDARFCENCGSALEEEIKVTPPPPTVVTAKLVTADGVEIELDFGSKSELLIGRADPVSRVFPDVDLTPHGGYEAGVSRRHCIIRYSGGKFTVEDLESTNGTKLNGKFIPPKVPQPLNDGDELVLGALVLKFHCK